MIKAFNAPTKDEEQAVCRWIEEKSKGISKMKIANRLTSPVSSKQSVLWTQKQHTVVKGFIFPTEFTLGSR